MSEPDIQTVDFNFIKKKWDQIHEKNTVSDVAEVLRENSFLLPENGIALDLACGLGENAIFLAEKGLDSNAWDISSVALKRVKQKALEKSLNVSVQQGFIKASTLPKNSFDVIVLSHFLDRSLSNAIMKSLKPNGLLFYQTYVRDKLGLDGPKNPDYLLARNELLELFQPLKLVVYRENNRLGDLNCGNRDEALFVGQKC
ncbi:MAG: methyltransferase domain-containing protein [Methylococcales bacterium]|nr:methyltransferase domain-containing protein [Methylococcales bacterium]